MSVDRVNHGDSRIYVNGSLLTGISDCQFTNDRVYEELGSLGNYGAVDRITRSDQIPKVSLSWILGESSSDPFFDFQSSGIVSVEKFDIKKADVVGQSEISGAFLTSYSVDAAVGGVVSAKADYEGLAYSFANTGSLQAGVQTEDYYSAFIPSKINIYSDFAEGNITSFPIQSFNINVPIPRSPLKKMGSMVADYRVPNLPSDCSVSFSVIKNDVTGMDFAPIILEKGDFTFDLRSCSDVGRTYAVRGCSLAGISESLNLDGNATIDFNYVSSLSADSFSLGVITAGNTVLDSNGNPVLGTNSNQVLS